MMKLEELSTKIIEIEESVDAEMSKEDLYDKLVVAYNYQKDIITILQDAHIQHVEDTTANDLAKDVQKYSEKLQALQREYNTLTASVNTIGEILQ